MAKRNIDRVKSAMGIQPNKNWHSLPVTGEHGMNDGKTQCIAKLSAVLMYAAIAGVYERILRGSFNDFLRVFGILILLRTAFHISEMLANIVAWHARERRVLVRTYTRFLKENEFPQREYAHDGLGHYLASLSNTAKYPERIRQLASEIQRTRELMWHFGVLTGSRYECGWEGALDVHSPRERAAIFRPHLQQHRLDSIHPNVRSGPNHCDFDVLAKRDEPAEENVVA